MIYEICIIKPSGPSVIWKENTENIEGMYFSAVK